MNPTFSWFTIDNTNWLTAPDSTPISLIYFFIPRGIVTLYLLAQYIMKTADDTFCQTFKFLDYIVCWVDSIEALHKAVWGLIILANS